MNAVSPAIIEDTKILKRSEDPLAKKAADCFYNYISQCDCANIDVTLLVLDATPMKRAGLPSEVASVVKFLAGPGASYMTGSIVLCDGGFNSSMPSENPADFPWHLAPQGTP